MISTTEPFAFAGGDLKPLSDSLVRTVRANDDAWLAEAKRWFFMPAPLLKAHQQLDRAVDRCYRPEPFPSDRHRVEYLFALYEQLTAPLVAAAKPARKGRRLPTTA